MSTPWVWPLLAGWAMLTLWVAGWAVEWRLRLYRAEGRALDAQAEAVRLRATPPPRSDTATARLIVVIHRAAGSPSVYVGPFATRADVDAWAKARRVSAGIIVPHHPDTDNNVLWCDPALMTDAEWGADA